MDSTNQLSAKASAKAGTNKQSKSNNTLSTKFNYAMHMLDLVWVKTKFNLKSEAQKNKLSYLWWVLEPLFYVAVFYIVFTKILDRGGPGYIYFLLSGMIPFQWFAKSISRGAPCILNEKSLLNQVNISPLFFPTVATLFSFIKYLPVLFLLLIFLAIFGDTLNTSWFYLPSIILAQMIFIYACTMLVSLLVPLLKDLLQIIPSLIQFTMFSSGVFFSIDRVPEQWREYVLLNPMANILHQYRLVLIEHQGIDLSLMVNLLITTSIIILLSIIVYKMNRLNYAKLVS